MTKDLSSQVYYVRQPLCLLWLPYLDSYLLTYLLWNLLWRGSCQNGVEEIIINLFCLYTNLELWLLDRQACQEVFFFSSYLLLLFLFLLIPWRKDADSLYKVAWVWEFQQNYASYHYPKFGSTIKTSRLNRSTWYHLQLGCVACWHLRLTWGRGNRGKWEIGVLLYCHQYCFGSRFDLNTYKDG